MELSAPAALPSLPARQGVLTRRLLGADQALLHELARAVGGPYHVVFPQAFDAAADAFRAVLAQQRVDGRIHFAKKANKAGCFVRCCADNGLGVDVASMGELRGALGGGAGGGGAGCGTRRFDRLRGPRLPLSPVRYRHPEGAEIGACVDFDLIDAGYKVGDVDAFATARAVARCTGLLIGGSAGGVVHQALALLDTVPPGSTMVGLVCDGGEKYLDSVFDDGWMGERDLLDPAAEARVRDVLTRWAP